MAQWLGAQTILAEDLSLVTSTQGYSQGPVAPVPGELM